jgi:hypothetical protein
MTYNASLVNPFYFMHGILFPLISGASITIADFATTAEDLVKELLEAKVSRMLMKGQVIEEWLTGFKNMILKKLILG